MLTQELARNERMKRKAEQMARKAIIGRLPQVRFGPRWLLPESNRSGSCVRVQKKLGQAKGVLGRFEELTKANKALLREWRELPKVAHEVQVHAADQFLLCP